MNYFALQNYGCYAAAGDEKLTTNLCHTSAMS